MSSISVVLAWNNDLKIVTMWTVMFLIPLVNLVESEPLRPLSPGIINKVKQKIDHRLLALSYMRLPGAQQDFNALPPVEHDRELIDSLPDSFDSRSKWPNCPSLHEIRDQGRCGNGWALSAVAAMTDRVCTYSNGTKNFHFSAEDLTTCNIIDQGGCGGGNPSAAWKFWAKEGLVSGGNYGSNEGCQPYTIPTCAHHIQECMKFVPTPDCKSACRDGYNVTYKEDKRHGKRAYALLGEKNLMAELYKNGPFGVMFAIYEDFANYTGGVYQHLTGALVGGHAAKLMGWGVEEGKKYWLIANSWGPEYGEKGYFKMLRGTNECEIEHYGSACAPILSGY